MMAEKGLNDASRGDGSCIAREEILHRDGTGNASRWKFFCIAMQKKGLFRTGNYELRGRKL